tara:strand:+ start:1073 stop:1378 length:306 start_codon:yes stop_codon:yes gene_type:complete
MAETKEFWLDGFEGPAKGGLFYRSKTAIDIEEVEQKFGVKVVGIKLEPDYESGRASWTIEYMTTLTKEDIAERYPEVLKAMVTGTDEIHEAEEEDKKNGKS